jgi:hypothetical protein
MLIAADATPARQTRGDLVTILLPYGHDPIMGCFAAKEQNEANGMNDIEGKAVRVAARE